MPAFIPKKPPTEPEVITAQAIGELENRAAAEDVKIAARGRAPARDYSMLKPIVKILFSKNFTQNQMVDWFDSNGLVIPKTKLVQMVRDLKENALVEALEQ